jgi:hypothetical protein
MRQQVDNIYENTAVLTNTRTDVTINAEVGELKENDSLNAYIAGTKVHMTWNGKIYVGNTHGMELTTPGPKLIRSVNTRGRY